MTRDQLVKCWAFWLIRLQHSESVTDFRYYAEQVNYASVDMYDHFRQVIHDVLGG